MGGVHLLREMNWQNILALYAHSFSASTSMESMLVPNCANAVLLGAGLRPRLRFGAGNTAEMVDAVMAGLGAPCI
jgi:hypothetical protein